jgi:hypothetical protein
LNERRKAIVGKFRASAVDRVKRIILFFGEVDANGEPSGDRLR